MKNTRTLLPGILIVLLLTVAITTAARPAAQIEVDPFAQPQTAAGNYCVSCHSPGDPRLGDPTLWKGEIGREVISPCPGATAVHEEMYYTERLMLAVDRSRASLGEGNSLAKTDEKIAANRQTYNRMLDQPVTSLASFRSEAQTLRYQMAKDYRAVNNAIEAWKMRQVLVWGLVVTLAILVSLLWGWYLTRKARGTGSNPSTFSHLARFLFLLGVFTFFALPLFTIPDPVQAPATVEEQERQAALDEASRAAEAGERAQARAWMLARVATAWGGSNPEVEYQVLVDAISGARESYLDQAALWGEALAAHEVSAAAEPELDKAAQVSLEAVGARGRIWGLSNIALEVMASDPETAAELLEEAEALTTRSLPPYRYLDLRSISAAWALLDPQRAVEIARQIEDPAIRSWAYRSIGESIHKTAYYAEAAAAARLIVNPVQRARALREIGTASGDREFFADARAALEGASGEALAYALGDLAVAAEDPAFAQEIDPAYPAARASAFYRLGEYAQAWDDASRILDPYEQARAQAAVAATALDANLARQIANSLYRDRALRDIAITTGDPAIAVTIVDPYYKVQAFTALGEISSALEEAGELEEPYPLVGLAIAIAAYDPERAMELMDAMDREADKAIVLRSAAAANPDADLFQRALGMALAARVRGDSSAPVQASLLLAEAFHGIEPQLAELAYQQAYEAALSIATK